MKNSDPRVQEPRDDTVCEVVNWSWNTVYLTSYHPLIKDEPNRGQGGL